MCDVFSTFHHLRDGFGGHYYGEMDSRKRRHGFGRCRWSNGDLYFGFWSKDQMHGEIKNNIFLFMETWECLGRDIKVDTMVRHFDQQK
jgi:hypothetical protein